VAEVAALLSAHRLVTLTGVGGAGKTRLALQVAADALPAFPDGAWLVALDSLRDPELVRLAAAQGQPARAARLWGAAAAQHQALLGRPLPAYEDPTLAQATEALRARLGDVAFDAAWVAGQAMSLDQAVAEALADAPDAGVTGRGGARPRARDGCASPAPAARPRRRQPPAPAGSPDAA
jgi:hypothetical protein